LHQVILNLVSNAEIYYKKGKLPWVFVWLLKPREHNGWVCGLDTGIGIPKEK
jgi:signal transduction histidine kinase